MKKALFFLPLTALIAVFTFTYCTKTDLAVPAAGENTDKPVSYRACGDPCQVAFTADNLNLLRVCGTTDNDVPCDLCSQVAYSGSTAIRGAGIINVTACKPFSITNNNGTDTYVSFDGGNTFTLIPANGGCEEFVTDGNCVVQ